MTIEQKDIDFFLRNLEEIIFEIRKQEDAREERSVPQAQAPDSIPPESSVPIKHEYNVNLTHADKINRTAFLGREREKM